METSALATKLRLQPGHRVLLLNAPEGYLDRLRPLPEGVELADTAGGKFDFVHLFARNSTDLAWMARQAVEAIEYDGVLWVSYPKKSAGVESDLNRDIRWEILEEAGLRPVTQVSIDDVWSALRFRPAERVGK
ncbi:MAG TPA: hypothetical protein VLC52_04730 [Anaerolineae bacterium]|nr:hypothetical protein [Anaerolineae bacterium]